MKFRNLTIGILSVFLLSSCFMNTVTSYEETNLTELTQAQNSATYYSLFKNNKTPKLNALGKQNVLVIPVVVKGFEINATSKVLNDINESFNGNSTSWKSVKGFYQESSYDKLDLNFTVSSWFNPNLTYTEMYAKNNGKTEGLNDGGTWNILESAVSWYKTNYPSDDITKYDNDKDGFIDSVWLIYSSPNHSKMNYLGIPASTNPFWAFTYFDYNNEKLSKVSNPVPFLYSWASYDFMYEGYGLSGIDSHTYIHETGHLLGLDDYYDVNGESNPMGCIDMMDYNIGDHNAFSKYALGWIKPYIVDKSMTVSIKSLVETGESLIVKSNKYNSTPFDEYFMIQFITPTGLNYKDYIEGYYKGLKVYSDYGVMITHVDARAGYISGQYVYYTDDASMMQYVPSSNSSKNKERLITLMQKDARSDINVFSKNYFPTNDALFYENDSFYLSGNSVYNYLMESDDKILNNNMSFSRKIYINEISVDSAKITIVF